MGKSYWHQEILELNDCFYRNLHKYEFIANFDLDEMVFPKMQHNGHFDAFFQNHKRARGRQHGLC